MNPWTAAVDALAAALTWTGDALGGGRAVGIPVLTFLVRAALIPVLAPLAVRTRDRMRVVRRIRPQIKELDRQFRDHPDVLEKRLRALHAEHGIGMVDWPGLGAALIQVPLLIALFTAVLSVWEAEALTASGAMLGLVAAVLSLASTKVSGQAEGAPWMLWMAGLLPMAICLWLGAGVGLYLTGFYAAGALQGAFMGRRAGSAPAEPA
jgi:membrane protein insertase Oxa1/YidC/SpoIIIJ